VLLTKKSPENNTPSPYRGRGNKHINLKTPSLNHTVEADATTYRPVVERTTMTAAMQLSDASTAAIAVLRVMSVGLGVNIRSSSNN